MQSLHGIAKHYNVVQRGRHSLDHGFDSPVYTVTVTVSTVHYTVTAVHCSALRLSLFRLSICYDLCKHQPPPHPHAAS